MKEEFGFKRIVITVLISLLVFSVLIFIYHKKFNVNNSGKRYKTEQKAEKQRSEFRENPLDRLKISLFDIRSPSLGLTSASVNFVLLFFNQSNVSIENSKINYDAYINGDHVSVGKIFLPIIPPNSRRKYKSSFTISYADVGKSLINSIRRKSFSLVLEGKINSGSSNKKFRIKYMN